MFDQIIPKLKTGEISVSTDTRTIKPGDVFFAIKGENFDGHAFVSQALEKGASVCVVSKEFASHEGADGFAGAVDYSSATQNIQEKFIIVDDTLKALQQLATQYRKQFSIPVIGISGCNGKTTTKNFMASVLKEHFGEEKVLHTLGNHNNFIGVPLTILSLREHHKASVIELGSNHPGEIAELCRIAQPTHGITTNIGAAHIEFFKSLEAIADEEGAIATFIPKGGAYILPKNDQYSEYIAQKAQLGVEVHFVDAKHVECFSVDHAKDGGIKKQLAHIGIRAPHIVQDALFVLTMAYALKEGITLQAALVGLSKTKNDKGRFAPRNMQLASGVSITVIDDTYNGNPDSVIAAISAMSELYPDSADRNARKIVCLGALRELGEYLHAGYERIVNMCNERGVAELVLIGIEDVFPPGETKLVYVKDNLECAEYLKSNAAADDVILCKGSKGSKTWEIIEHLER